MQHQAEVNDLANEMNQLIIGLPKPRRTFGRGISMGRSKNRAPRPKKVNHKPIYKRRAASVTIIAGLNCF